jgi:diaminopimelate decarboxylase
MIMKAANRKMSPSFGKDRSRFSPLFEDALRQRETLLPPSLLNNYIRGLLDKREIFLESAARFGTPQYFFDEPSLAMQITRFHEAFSRHFDRYRVFYAMKSNDFHGLCRKILESGAGLDVSSGFELSRALAMDCREITFSGPGKTDEELLAAVQNPQRVTLLLDSPGELRRTAAILKGNPPGTAPLRVGIRVRSKTQGHWTKFGVPLGDLGPMLKNASATGGLLPCGIQFHTSWNMDPSKQVEMIDRIGLTIQRHVPPALRESLAFIDIGGGFWPEQGEWLNPRNTPKGRLLMILDSNLPFRKRHYLRAARSLDDFAREITAALSRQGPPLSNLETWIEPGRWISTPAMHILLKVIDKKDSKTVITDGGTNLLGWERPLTEFIPLINLTRPSSGERIVRVFGSLCTPHDVWGASVFGTGIEPGDILLVPDQGAYTYSLRQSFIKPRARVIRFAGGILEEAEKEERHTFRCP